MQAGTLSLASKQNKNKAEHGTQPMLVVYAGSVAQSIFHSKV